MERTANENSGDSTKATTSNAPRNADSGCDPECRAEPSVMSTSGRSTQRGETKNGTRPPKKSLLAASITTSPASTAQLRRAPHTARTQNITNPIGSDEHLHHRADAQRELSMTLRPSHGHRPSFRGPWMNSTSRQGK